MNIEATVTAAIDELALGDVFTFDELLETMQSRRQRPPRILELIDVNHDDGLCGLWFMTEAEDLVMTIETDSTLHRQQFVLHELAHMLLEHGDDEDAIAPDILLPDIDPSTVRRLLRRRDLDTPQEVAAESLADRLAAGIRGSALHSSRYLEIFG